MDVQEQMLSVKGYQISPDLFKKGFPAGGGPCTCTARCCEGGVYVDLRERDWILAHQELIKQQMDETQSKDAATWFEQEVYEHTDFPSGRCIGTQEINQKCTFLDGQGRCSLQVASVAAGQHKWTLKPLYCILYPIEITDKVVGFDNLLQEEEHCCTICERFAMPFFQGCREELVHLLGEDGYEAIVRHYRQLQSHSEEER
ncbi:MAG TPA: DUF3109 family protein [Bacteroidota bacterium]